MQYSTSTMEDCFISLFLQPHSTTKVATTRVPVFDDTLQNPGFHYRHLGNLGDIPWCLEIPSNSVNSTREVFAMDTQNNFPATVAFCRSRMPLGFNFDTHFFVIFLVPHPLLTITPSISEQSILSSSHSDFGSAQTPSPSLNTNFELSTPGASTTISDNDSDLQGFFASNLLSASSHGYSSAAAQAERGSDISSVMNAEISSSITLPQPQSQLLVHEAAESNTGQSAVVKYCLRNGAALEDIERAKYKSDSDAHLSLFSMIKNLQAMSDLLTQIGLPGYRDDPNCSTKTDITLCDGVRLTSETVIRDLCWSRDTYKKKAKAYLWAEDAVRTKKWIGTTSPGK